MMQALKEAWIKREEAWDRRFAMIGWIIAEVNRDPKRKSRAYEISDFMPYREPTKTELMDKIRKLRTLVEIHQK